MTKDELNLVVRDAKKGSQKAFSTLYNLFNKTIYNLIYNIVKNKDLADDLSQEAFTKAFMKLDKYTSEISFEMWLKTIANNVSIDFIRIHSKKTYSSVDADEELKNHESDYNNPEESYILNESKKVVSDNIKKLGNKARVILSMRYDEGLSYKEIASRAGISIGTVKSYISKATNKIKPN